MPRSRDAFSGVDRGVDPRAFLEHDRHAEPTIRFFLGWFRQRGQLRRDLPSAGILLTVRSRFDSSVIPPDRGEICAGWVPAAVARFCLTFTTRRVVALAVFTTTRSSRLRKVPWTSLLASPLHLALARLASSHTLAPPARSLRRGSRAWGEGDVSRGWGCLQATTTENREQRTKNRERSREKNREPGNLEKRI